MSLCFYEAVDVKASFNELLILFVCFKVILLAVLREALLVIFKEAVTLAVLQCSLKTMSDAF